MRSWKLRVIQILLSNANCVIRKHTHKFISAHFSWNIMKARNNTIHFNKTKLLLSAPVLSAKRPTLWFLWMWQNVAKTFKKNVRTLHWQDALISDQMRIFLEKDPAICKSSLPPREAYRLVLKGFTPWVTCFPCFSHHLWFQSAGNLKPSTTEDFHRKGSLWVWLYFGRTSSSLLFYQKKDMKTY